MRCRKFSKIFFDVVFWSIIKILLFIFWNFCRPFALSCYRHVTRSFYYFYVLSSNFLSVHRPVIVPESFCTLLFFCFEKFKNMFWKKKNWDFQAMWIQNVFFFKKKTKEISFFFKMLRWGTSSVILHNFPLKFLKNNL